MNNLDIQYQELLKDILKNGVVKTDRTGTGTISVFGRTIRHKMSDGFPLLTTKKMFTKGIIAELIWFLKGDTNIKYLLENDCHIWDGDAYKAYEQEWMKENPPFGGPYVDKILSKKEFINKIKTDNDFANKWGELGKIYGFQWRNWGGKSDDELYSDYLNKVENK
jgi:thymidylate synthase